MIDQMNQIPTDASEIIDGEDVDMDEKKANE